jgi:hypothetical protein
MFFTAFSVASLYYYVEYFWISKYANPEEDHIFMWLFNVSAGSGVMFFMAYFMRRVLCRFFLA